MQNEILNVKVNTLGVQEILLIIDKLALTQKSADGHKPVPSSTWRKYGQCSEL